MSSLPVSDARVLTLARDACTMRGFATGADVRDRYIQACRRGGFHPRYSDVGATVSWTAALKRLAKDGQLKQIDLVTRRGNPGGIGFERPFLPAMNRTR